MLPFFYAFSYIVYKFFYYPEFVALSCKKSKQSVKIVFDEINRDVLVDKFWKYRLQKFKKYLLRKSKYICWDNFNILVEKSRNIVWDILNILVANILEKYWLPSRQMLNNKWSVPSVLQGLDRTHDQGQQSNIFLRFILQMF